MSFWVKSQEGRELHPYRWLLGLSVMSILSYFRLLTRIRHLGRQLGLEGHLEKSVSFCLCAVPRVLLLLYGVVFFVGILGTFVAPERAKARRKDRLPITGHSLAAFLGGIAPFCSGSAFPLFVGFARSGVPLGITFSFLIAAPMVNEVSLHLMARGSQQDECQRHVRSASLFSTNSPQ